MGELKARKGLNWKRILLYVCKVGEEFVNSNYHVGMNYTGKGRPFYSIVAAYPFHFPLLFLSAMAT